MHRHAHVPIVEYMLVCVVLLLSMALMQWLSPFVSRLAVYPMSLS